MIVHCRDRSMPLPRKKGKYIKRKPPAVINNLPKQPSYRSDEAQPRYVSVLERRCNREEWEDREGDEALAWLEDLAKEQPKGAAL